MMNDSPHVTNSYQEALENKARELRTPPKRGRFMRDYGFALSTGTIASGMALFGSYLAEGNYLGTAIGLGVAVAGVAGLVSTVDGLENEARIQGTADGLDIAIMRLREEPIDRD